MSFRKFAECWWFTSNTSYSRGRDQEHHCWKSARENSSWDL